MKSNTRKIKIACFSCRILPKKIIFRPMANRSSPWTLSIMNQLPIFPAILWMRTHPPNETAIKAHIANVPEVRIRHSAWIQKVGVDCSSPERARRTWEDRTSKSWEKLAILKTKRFWNRSFRFKRTSWGLFRIKRDLKKMSFSPDWRMYYLLYWW